MSSDRTEIQRLQECLRQKNLELDALHYVWCTGRCKGGQHRWVDGHVTEEMVEIAERVVKRLRTSWNNVEFGKLTDEERAVWFATKLPLEDYPEWLRRVRP